MKVLLELGTGRSVFWDIAVTPCQLARAGEGMFSVKCVKSISAQTVHASEISAFCQAPGELLPTWLSGIMCMVVRGSFESPFSRKVQLFPGWNI